MPLDQICQQPETLSGLLDESVVIGGDGDNWVIRSDSGEFNARKAFSCLVRPEIGDKVLSVSLASMEVSILAILERDEPRTTQLKFEGNVDISSPRSINMLAGERLDAFAGDRISFDASELSLRSKLSTLLFDKLSVTGSEAVHSIGSIQVLAKTIETVSETSKQVTKNASRLVSGLDSLSAGEVLQNIKKRFTLQSRQVSLLAEDDARLNGTRVHLG